MNNKNVGAPPPRDGEGMSEADRLRERTAGFVNKHVDETLEELAVVWRVVKFITGLGIILLMLWLAHQALTGAILGGG